MPSQSIALRQCLKYIFLYFHLSVFKRGETRWHESANQERLKELQIMRVRIGNTMTLILNV